MNSFYAFILLRLCLFGRLINHQNHYIKKLEYHNTIASQYIAKAYIRAAKGHFLKQEYIQSIDKCTMAVYTYSFNSLNAYKICCKAYRILNQNSQLYEGLHFWMRELFENHKLLKTHSQ